MKGREVSDQAEPVETQNALVQAQPGQQQLDYAVGKAKQPVPPAFRTEAEAGNQPGQGAAVINSLRVQALPGQMGGYVVDPSGAVVANARVTITRPSSGTAATTVTDPQGRWVIAGLLSGNYRAQVQAPGFKTAALDLNYDARQPSMYNFLLNVGSASETVEVASAQNAIQTETATIGGAIANREVSQLGVNGRNFAQLAGVTPGASAPLPRWTISPSGGLQRSFDQGRTWQDVDVSANLAPAATFTNYTSVSELTETARAKDSSADKKALKKAATAVVIFRAVAAIGAEVWAGGSSAALYHSLDAGGHWIRVLPSSGGATLTGDIVAVQFSDTQHGEVTTSTTEVWLTSDDGQTWQKQ
jgi:hypothetical protein